MNRPRNRQPRPPRGNQQQQWSHPPSTPQQSLGKVPKFKEVVPGVAVFVVAKEDQPTGRESKGIVQDVLTAGDHPRGIKVRLRGGLVGRVQRLDGGSQGQQDQQQQQSGAAGSSRSTIVGAKYTDVRNDLDDYPEAPPPRSLADFMPAAINDEPNEEDWNSAAAALASVTATRSQDVTAICPLCDDFQGDEVAVTYHIETVHLNT